VYERPTLPDREAETAEQLAGTTGQEAKTMKRLIECVAKFSEGRDAAKLMPSWRR